MPSSSGLLLVVLVPILALTTPKADICSHAPPTLWCSLGEDLEQQCGFKELCDRYATAVSDEPVRLTLFYEAMCAGCQIYVTETIPALLDAFGDDGKFLEFELVPYGNAHIVNGTIHCQHYPNECTYNRWESCILAHAGNKALKTVICVETELKNNPRASFSDDLAKCYSSLEIDQDTQDAIAKCNSTDEGWQLQLAAANRTESASPDPKHWVPWVSINDVSVKAAQLLISDLINDICLWYKGSEVPKPCKQN